LKDKTVVVTGGGKGIGRGIVLARTLRRAVVSAATRRLDAVVVELQALGVRHWP
jgi:NAD(P)-dependent dehydrogenase (short-subunit alcohol dehydrogenase family)